jgi:hypothetical protein
MLDAHDIVFEDRDLKTLTATASEANHRTRISWLNNLKVAQ